MRDLPEHYPAPVEPQNVIYCGAFEFPDRSPGGVRVLGIARALRLAGYSVRFIGIESTGQLQDLRTDGGYAFDGFEYFPDERSTIRKASRLSRILRTHITGLSM